MRKTWMTGIVTGTIVCLLAFTVTRTIHAQGGGTPPTWRAACVDVMEILNGYQRQMDLNEEANGHRMRLETESQSRQKRIEEMKATIDALDMNDPTRAQRLQEFLAMQVDFKNWAELAQLSLTREFGIWSGKAYEEALASIAAIAQRDGYDLVLYRGEFEAMSFDPNELAGQIRSHKLLYANPSVDITQAVLDKLNADYRAQPKQQMMQVP